MAAQKGSLVLIKIGNGAGTEVFTTIGGLRASALVLGNQALDATTLASGVWRQLLTGAGIRSLRLSGSGIFTDAASEELLRGYAFAGSVNNYRFVFPNGDNITGPFLVNSYSRSGEIDGEEIYAMTLESAGAITFTAG